jgi:hypothetical protein
MTLRVISVSRLHCGGMKSIAALHISWLASSKTAGNILARADGKQTAVLASRDNIILSTPLYCSLSE